MASSEMSICHINSPYPFALSWLPRGCCSRIPRMLLTYTVVSPRLTRSLISHLPRYLQGSRLLDGHRRSKAPLTSLDLGGFFQKGWSSLWGESGSPRRQSRVSLFSRLRETLMTARYSCSWQLLALFLSWIQSTASFRPHRAWNPPRNTCDEMSKGVITRVLMASYTHGTLSSEILWNSTATREAKGGGLK